MLHSQGVVVEGASVRAPYAYQECDSRFNTISSSTCVAYEVVEVESTPLIPPFSYNNQCAAVLLTSYIPVLIIAYAIQLVSSFAVSAMLSQAGLVCDVSKIIHAKVNKGIIWPEFWATEDAFHASHNKDCLDKDPALLLNTKAVLCFDILSSFMVLLSFGICSPMLAVATTCVLVSKMKVLTLLVGRFTAVLSDESHGGSENGEVHMAIKSLARVLFPLSEVMRRAFWLIAWFSALFIAMVCWDIAADDVGWEDALWLPLAAVGYPALLYVVDFCCTHVCVEERDPAATRLKGGKGSAVNHVELAAGHTTDPVTSVVCQNPLLLQPPQSTI
jgi:hypothetical protein